MILRKLKEKDADGMLEWMHDPELQTIFPFPMMAQTREDVLHFIDSAEICPVEGKSIHFAIADEKDEYLGTISLKNINMVSKNAEFAISLRESARGKGIAVQATVELLKKAFEDFQLERVYLCVFTSNLRAIKLYEKIGFTYEGESRNHICLYGEYKTLRWYGMLKSEYIERLGR